MHKRSLVVVFSDMMDDSDNIEDMFSALQHLRYNKHEVILFNVCDKPKEIDFAYENRPYHFIDLETNEQMKVNPTEIKEQYLENISKFRKELILKCGQYKIDLIETDINKPIEDVLLPFLIKRSKLF